MTGNELLQVQLRKLELSGCEQYRRLLERPRRAPVALSVQAVGDGVREVARRLCTCPAT
jgi:hypothetical protein